MGAKLPTESHAAAAAHDAAQASDQAHGAVAAAKAKTAKTPEELAAMITADPQNTEAYVKVAQQTQGNAFATAAVALAHQQAPGGKDGKDGKPAADPKAHEDPVKALTAKWGAHPRKYEGLVDGSNAAELVFRDTAPKAVAFINQKAAARGLKMRLSVAELTTNFIAEGGFYVLDGNMTEGVDGFQHLGIDTFMDRIDALRPWLHPSIEQGKLVTQEATNELGKTVHSITSLTIIQAVYASAAMMAWNKSVLEHDTKGTKTPIDKMSPSEQYYFETMYFNAGPGFGKKVLGAQGTAAAHRKWGHEDDANKYGGNAQFNATWRTSTYELMNQQTMPGDKFKPPSEETATAGNADLGAKIDDLKVRLGQADGMIQQTKDYLAQLQAAADTTPEQLKATQAAVAQAVAGKASQQELLDEMVKMYKPAAAAKPAAG
jgi:hypothetical protein